MKYFLFFCLQFCFVNLTCAQENQVFNSSSEGIQSNQYLNDFDRELKKIETVLAPEFITVPLNLHNHIPTIDLILKGPDGTEYTARFLIDTGGGSFIISNKIAREIGVEAGETISAEGTEFAIPKSAPLAFIENFELDLNPQRVIIAKDEKTFTHHYEGLLPGHLLAKYHVIFDYPNETFTLAKPEVLEPKGSPLTMPVSEMMGFPYTEIEIDGNTYGFLLDTGPAATIFSHAILEKLSEKHPDWQRSEGAVGITESLAEAGGQVIETMIIPGGKWGDFELDSFVIASQQEGIFEEYISPMMAKPVIGALAGNVLKHFRIELDYKNETLFLSKP